MNMTYSNCNPRILLSLLWISTMFLMVFADIFSIITELVIGNQIQIPMEVTSAMTLAALVTSIPSLMIVLSWVLPYKASRKVNMIAAVFTIIYVIVGGSLIPHYIILAGMEIVLLSAIVLIARKWNEA